MGIPFGYQPYQVWSAIETRGMLRSLLLTPVSTHAQKLGATTPAEISLRKCLQSCLQKSPPTLLTSYGIFWNPPLSAQKLQSEVEVPKFIFSLNFIIFYLGPDAQYQNHHLPSSGRKVGVRERKNNGHQS